ncbi:ATP synthase F0 subunit B [Desulfurobacterium atlanticum]|uniref:ATP synthase subunit b n=1 Tax=Desulfurobacterium atlanticum TaxID=240169 RepID=A0A238YJ95_9BACT|nr:ATP synthase F0 subunit B [Desulfurobacterium atlanticum]SNR71120.1 F-type H+-transporting ATPase subunit b [Desulfurobacterium atlanticum]
MEGNIVSLNGTVIIQMVNFLVFMVVMDKVLFKPMITHLAKREEELKLLSIEAEELRKAAEKFLQEYEAIIAEAKRKAKELLDAALREAKEEKDKIIAQAQEEMQQRIEKARAEIWASFEEEKAKLEERVDEIANEIVEKLLKKAA